MTLCDDVAVPPALIHPSHDMRWSARRLSGTCEQCLAYVCLHCGPDQAEGEALTAGCQGRGWWDEPGKWGQRPVVEGGMPCRSR